MKTSRHEGCPSCAADPTCAPGRYCASRACRCGHPDCPAFASYRPLERPFGYLALLHPPKTDDQEHTNE